jgi:DNA-binding transcriptional MocR family regulator
MRHHRQAGKHWLEYTGAKHIDEDRVLISNGGQHGFFTALLALCQRGDTILSDGLTYPGLINTARQLGLRLIGLDMDEQGSTPEALELACQRHQPRAIYLMPRLNNPTSRQMSRERVEALATICRKHRLHIIEDDVQGCLTDTEHTTFTNVAPDISILVSSCSKALVGGLRVGYIHPTEQTFEPIANALKSSCWMIAPLPTEVASRWITSERAGQIIEAQRNELEIRHQIVAEHLQDYRYESVSSAFNVWLHLPEQWRAAEFARRAAEVDILLKPAELFAAGQYPAPQAVRFCVGGELSRERLKSGLVRLVEILGEMPGGTEGLV